MNSNYYALVPIKTSRLKDEPQRHITIDKDGQYRESFRICGIVLNRVLRPAKENEGVIPGITYRLPDQF